MSVQGIGEIELPVKTHLTRNGSNSQGTLTLVDVLYVPSVECNILGNPLLATCDIDLKPGTISKIIDSRTGKTVGLLDESKVWRLRLRGQSPAQSSLDEKENAKIQVNWPEEQRDKWHKAKRGLVLSSGTPASESQTSSSQRASSASTVAVKGLKGARGSGDTASMTADATASEPKIQAEKKQEAQSHQSPAQPAETAPKINSRSTHNDVHRATTSQHTPVGPLTPKGKAWLKDEQLNERSFLLTYGLAIHKDDERAKGRAILRAFMARE